MGKILPQRVKSYLSGFCDPPPGITEHGSMLKASFSNYNYVVALLLLLKPPAMFPKAFDFNYWTIYTLEI